jgi:ubiquinone/menaquinone biosynthesis C-methylase UbiE
MIGLVCPACHNVLFELADTWSCSRCGRTYPIIGGIADLRLEPDPYIGIDADRDKAAHLADAAHTRTFAELVRYYYSITPEDPPDLAAQWTTRAIDEVRVGGAQIDALGFAPATGPVLDLGCGTAGLTIAIAQRGVDAIGVDIALRWLVVARHRPELRQSRVTLVCASARHLPFGDGTMHAVMANDVIEHADRPADVLAEAARVSAPGAVAVFTGNNRFAPLPEPHMRLWGVGYLPRQLQRRYVGARRRDTHPYRIVLRSGREVARLIAAAGFSEVRTLTAPLAAPHRSGPAFHAALRTYNRARRLPVIRSALRLAGPRWLVTARRA